MTARIGWSDLPEQVRRGIEGILGEPVVAADSQPGGFSPGSADRVQLASGGRVFVKAVSGDVNTTAVRLHRREAAIAAALPDGLPVPQFLGSYDDGTWVALAFTDVDGRHPALPWTNNDAELVLAALADVAGLPLPTTLELPRSGDALRGAFMGWEKLRRRPMEGLGQWAGENMELLVELARYATGSMAGESLVHGDLRADNVLLTTSGVVLVDWPWASRGAGWLDSLSILIDVNTGSAVGHAETLLGSHPVFRGVGPRAVTGVLAGWSGYYLDMSRRPAPSGMPDLRTFQRKQADALIGWLQLRLPAP